MILRNLAKLASCLLKSPSIYLRDMGLVDATNNGVYQNSSYTYTTQNANGVSLERITTGNNSFGNLGGIYVYLGSGTTQPTFNDYCLEAEVANKDSITYTTTNASFAQTAYKVVYTATITNTSTDTGITFTEIMLGFYINGYNTNYNPSVIALTRDVISPVTIPAGASKTITVVIDFASMATSVA